MKIIADETWYLTADGRRVPKRDPRARRLLVGKGCEIDEAELSRYPLLEATTEGKAIASPPETKAVKAPKR